MDQKVLEVSSLSLSFSDYLPTYLPIDLSIYLCIYFSIDLSLSLFHLITYLAICKIKNEEILRDFLNV